MTTAVLPEVADLDTFGGAFVDADAVVDPETEVAASYFNRLVAQAAMASHTLPRAWVRVTAGSSPTVADHDAVWGNSDSVKPTVARSGAGVYTVTWASSYNDLQDTPESHTVSIRAASANGSHSGALRHVQHELTSAVVVTVRSFNSGGSATDVDSFFLQVW